MLYLQVAMQKENPQVPEYPRGKQIILSKKPIEKQIKDTVFKEMYLFLKETLLPLGFDEQYWEGQWLDYHVSFTRGLVLITIMHEIREQFYELNATTDSDKKAWMGDPENGYEVTDFEFRLFFQPEKNEKGKYRLPDKDKRAREYEKFMQWLIEKQIN